MAESDKLKVSLILLGKEANPILEILSKIKNIELTIICATYLNYELPRSEDKKPIFVRGELIQTLKSLTSDIEVNFPIPPTIKKSYMEDLKGIEDEQDIGIIYNINTIEDHSQSLIETFDGLEKLLGETETDILPLTDEDDDIIIYKNKKWAPLRYYLCSGKLPFDESKYNVGNKKVKMGVKSLRIHGLDQLNDDKIPEETVKALENADLILFSATDLTSLGVFFKLNSVLKQLEKIAKVDRSIIVWNETEVNETEKEILEILELEPSIESFLEPISSFIDYVILGNDNEANLEAVRAHGTKFITEKLPSNNVKNEDPSKYIGLIESLISLGDSSITPEFERIEDQVDGEEEESNGTTKTLDQLQESEKEQGIQKLSKTVDEDEEMIEETTSSSKSNIQKNESEKTSSKSEEKSGEEKSTEAKNDNSETEVNGSKFDPEVSESWEDALKGAISNFVEEGDDLAYTWIIKQIERDPDLSENLSQVLLHKILVAEGSAAKKKMISLLKQIYSHIKQSVIQVFSAYLLNTISSKEFEKARDFVHIFTLLQSEMMEFCEDIVKSIIKDITAKRENPLIFEMSKLTLVQMVISSRRLKRIAIAKILTLMDARIDTSPMYLWNFLMCFDAGSVAVELVTQFSISRSEELINRTPLLRYTGSFFTTLQMVMTYWKAGDQIAITEITGSILPDNTIRKLERMDLASKIEKLGTVPLSTLAQTLGKDPETIERLIAELIMNDDIDVRLEVVDNRMIVMYNSNSS